ncbi:hypothetical protein Tco_0463040 [Tanacetum coccineum]
MYGAQYTMLASPEQTATDSPGVLPFLDALIRPLKALESANVALACVRDQAGVCMGFVLAFAPFSRVFYCILDLAVKGITVVSG